MVFTGFSREDGFAYTANTAAESVPSNIYNPAPLPLVRGARLDPRRSADTTLTSVAVADTMSFFDETVLLTAGVRYQMVNQLAYSTSTGARTSEYDADATSPLAGIVIKPSRNVAVYANYAEGLTSGTIVGPGYSNTGAILIPSSPTSRRSASRSTGEPSRRRRLCSRSAGQAKSGPRRTRSPMMANSETKGLELSAFGAVHAKSSRLCQRDLPAPPN